MRMRDLDVGSSGDRSSGTSVCESLLLRFARGRRNVVGDVGVDSVKLMLLLLSGNRSSLWRSVMLLSAVSSRGILAARYTCTRL
jgi:hypothetical protein